MPKQNFDLLVFDWDGTLMNSTGHIVRCIQAACRDLDVPDPDPAAARYIIGLGVVEALRIAVPTLQPSEYPKLVERFRFHYLQGDSGQPASSIELFAGVAQLLTELRAQGYLLAVATGSSREGLDRAIRMAEVSHLFDATRCADETFSKPNPAMLYELTQELGQELDRTLMIGDTTHDLQMAANAGVAAVAVAYGAHSADVLQTLQPRFCAADVGELADWLRCYA